MNTKRENGFSLVELMVTIGIIGTLVAIGFPSSRRFYYKAKEAEAATNIGSIVSLANAYYYDENDRVSAMAGTYLLAAMSNNTFTSTTSCNRANPLGFQITDCSKVGYVYGLMINAVSKTLGAFAIEGGSVGNKRIYRSCCGSSYWTASTGAITHTISPSVNANCLSTWNTKVGAAFGGSDRGYDTDGDGVIGLNDTSAIGMAGAMLNFGTATGHWSGC